MIAFMIYVSAISLLLVVAAAASEPLLRAIRRPTRSAWLAAVFSAAILALATLWAPPRTVPAPAPSTKINRAFEIGSAPSVPLPLRDHGTIETLSTNAREPAKGSAPSTPSEAQVIAVCWLVASLGCLAWLLVLVRRVGRLRRSCSTGRLCGERVLVSDSVGPAVLGVLRHRIVVPAWVEELDEDAQRLILAHEREHMRAKDPLVLHAVMLLVALMPWNIAFWFALHRLRAAIEIDCDARVLARALRGHRPAARDYCRMLLEVGERTIAVASPLLALAKPATLLERRIESMTTTRKVRDWKTLVPAAGALLLIAGACRAPRPAIAPDRLIGGKTGALAQHPAPAVVMQTATPGSPTLPALPALSLTASSPHSQAAFSVGAPKRDSTVRNEEALRRSAEAHQAHINALADSVILASYPELTHRPPGTPAFLALVLDDREHVIRHAISLDPVLPNDLAAIMLALHADTISARTLGLGISDDNPWHVTVGHAVEALGPVRGRSEMWASMTSPRPYALYKVPYQRIVDSVARARSPEAYQQHEGTFAIAMLLDEAGHVTRYGAEPRTDPSWEAERSSQLMNRLIGDSTRAGDIVGVRSRLVPSKTLIVWGVQR